MFGKWEEVGKKKECLITCPLFLFIAMGTWELLVKSYRDLFYEQRDLFGRKGSRPEVLFCEVKVI